MHPSDSKALHPLSSYLQPNPFAPPAVENASNTTTKFTEQSTFLPPNPFQVSPLPAPDFDDATSINPLMFTVSQMPHLKHIFSPSSASTETITSLADFRDPNIKTSYPLDVNVSPLTETQRHDFATRHPAVHPVGDQQPDNRLITRPNIPVITGAATLKQSVDLRFLLHWRPALRHILGPGICEKARTTIEEILLRLISVVLKGNERSPYPHRTSQSSNHPYKFKDIDWYREEMDRLNERYESAHRQISDLSNQLMKISRELSPTPDLSSLRHRS